MGEPEELEKIAKKIEEFVDESFVIKSVREHLGKNGWNLKPPKESKHHKGPDIEGSHSELGKRLILEAKGDGKSPASEHQIIHNAFPMMIGQIVSRMQVKDNSIVYGVAFPARWASVFGKKIKEMEWAWKTLDLVVFVADKNGKVVESTSSDVWGGLAGGRQ